MGKATQDLRNEHDAILFVLQILDKMMQSKEQSKETMLQYYGEFVYFLQIFADKCHHGKEELYLFQEMVRQGIANEGGPIGVMLEEHVRGRGYIAHMSHALEGNDLIAFHDAAVKVLASWDWAVRPTAVMALDSDRHPRLISSLLLAIA